MTWVKYKAIDAEQSFIRNVSFYKVIAGEIPIFLIEIVLVG